MARILVETTKMVSSKGYIDVPDYISKEELRDYVWQNYDDIRFTEENVVDDSETLDDLDYEQSEALKAAQMHFESGTDFSEKDFSDDFLLDGLTEYERYCKYLEYGPAGFYEEFKDILNFNKDLIAEYE